MKFSLNWLQDFVDVVEQDPEVIAAVLTEKVAEVEGFLRLGEGLDRVVIGEIMDIAPHPDADKVRITKTRVGESEAYQILCGAKNIEVGQKVPVALVGACLPGDPGSASGAGFKIEKRKIRGVESCGMLCSKTELRIGEDAKGIFILPKDAPIGTQLTEYLPIADTVFEIENTSITNRPDLFSHAGMAREMVAVGLAKEKEYPSPCANVKALLSDAKIPFTFDVSPKEICPIRSNAYVTNLKVESSPEWMQHRLSACGIRPINNLVDISNYVMLEHGIPLHIFDAKKITGNDITMRLSREGEKVTTLDGIERTLPAGIILQEDCDKVFDLAGIMGGENSEVSDETTEILVHVPVYDATTIRRASLALGHRTDAATIYEKRVPNRSARLGMWYTLKYLQELCPGAKFASEIEEVENVPQEPVTLEIHPQMIADRIGVQLETQEIQDILEKLSFRVERKGEFLTVSVPPHRLGDITIPEDLIEEVARIHGLNTMGEVAPQMLMKPNPLPPLRRLVRELSDTATAHGFWEILTFSFLGPQLLNRCDISVTEEMVELANPLSIHQSLMRTSLLPRLLEKIEENLRYQETVSFFEIGRVFPAKKQERYEASFLSTETSFEAMKGLLEAILEPLGLVLQYTKTNASGFGSQIINVSAQGKILAELYPLRSSIAKRFGMETAPIVLTMFIDELLETKSQAKKIHPLPKFPSVEWDISLLAPSETLVGEIVSPLKQLSSRIEKTEVVEVYEGKGVAEGQKSVTLHFVFRDPTKTLTEEEVLALEAQIKDTAQAAGYPPRF